MVLHPGTTLGQRLGVDKKFSNLWSAYAREETMLHPQNNLRDNLQITVDKHVEGMSHDAFGRVLDRDHTVIGAILANFSKNLGDGLLRGIMEARPETSDGCLMGKGCFRTEVSDGHGLLQREGAGHDFAVNGAK